MEPIESDDMDRLGREYREAVYASIQAALAVAATRKDFEVIAAQCESIAGYRDVGDILRDARRKMESLAEQPDLDEVIAQRSKVRAKWRKTALVALAVVAVAGVAGALTGTVRTWHRNVMSQRYQSDLSLNRGVLEQYGEGEFAAAKTAFTEKKYGDACGQLENAVRKAYERKRVAETERKRLAEEAERKRLAEAERQRLAEEAERKRLAEVERKRWLAEVERKRLAEEVESRRASEVKRQRLTEEAESKRLSAENANVSKPDLAKVQRIFAELDVLTKELRPQERKLQSEDAGLKALAATTNSAQLVVLDLENQRRDLIDRKLSEDPKLAPLVAKRRELQQTLQELWQPVSASATGASKPDSSKLRETFAELFALNKELRPQEQGLQSDDAGLATLAEKKNAAQRVVLDLEKQRRDLIDRKLSEDPRLAPLVAKRRELQQTLQEMRPPEAAANAKDMK